MGNQSRGGNGGLTASGGRQREDKELRKAAAKPRSVGRPGSGSAAGERGAGGSESGKRNSGNRRRLRGFGNGLNGFGGLPNFNLPNAAKPKKAAAAKKKAAKTTSPPAATKASKIPTIKRIRGPKVKLTKQRTNKAPN